MVDNNSKCQHGTINLSDEQQQQQQQQHKPAAVIDRVIVNELKQTLATSIPSSCLDIESSPAAAASIRLETSNPTSRHQQTNNIAGTTNNKFDNVDGPYAWFILFCVFILNTTTLGALKVYGLIFERIVRLSYYNREDASWPIATASTIQNFAGLLTPTLTKFMSWRQVELLQTSMFVVSNLGAYFSSKLYLDILCLGVIQGIAFSLRYNMNIVINNEYFERYRTTAMGISMAGSTCGVFFLSPLVSYALDLNKQQFRLAYLALAIIMAFNYIFNMFIRPPRPHNNACDKTTACQNGHQSGDDETSDNNIKGGQQLIEELSWREMVCLLARNPFFHCIWIMQTIYFYISRTYTIILVDLAIDMGFETTDARSLLNYWVYGELLGRLLLGPVVDSNILSIKYCTIVTCLITGASSFLLIASWLHNQYVCYCLITIFVAAFTSLIAMLIVPFAQSYLHNRQQVPWAYALGAFISSLFLLVRPKLIGLSRDTLHSYNLLIIIMASAPILYAMLLLLLEPLLLKQQHNKKQQQQQALLATPPAEEAAPDR